MANHHSQNVVKAFAEWRLKTGIETNKPKSIYGSDGQVSIKIVLIIAKKVPKIKHIGIFTGSKIVNNEELSDFKHGNAMGCLFSPK